MLADGRFLQECNDGTPKRFRFATPRFERRINMYTRSGWRHLQVLTLGSRTTIVWRRKSAMETDILQRTVGIRDQRETLTPWESSQNSGNGWLVFWQWNCGFHEVSATDEVRCLWGLTSVTQFKALTACFSSRFFDFNSCNGSCVQKLILGR
jgi:hypothetical protein